MQTRRSRFAAECEGCDRLGSHVPVYVSVTDRPCRSVTFGSMDATISALRTWIETTGQQWLADDNITGIDIAHKVVEGMTLDVVCLRFTVRRKLAAADPAATIPPYVSIGERIVPTDVIEARPLAAARQPARACA